MKKIINIILATITVIGLSVGCSTDTSQEVINIEDKGNKEVKVMSPDGLPSIALAKLIKENPNIYRGYDITYTIEKTTENLSTDIMKQEADIAVVPSNMAAIAYNKTSNYQIAGTVGMGSFYLVSTEDINGFEDLIGKTVGNTGKGLTPDITVNSILKLKGINTDEVDFTYVNSASELVPLLATGKISTGIVPEPALTGLMQKYPNIKIIKSLNDEWKEVNNSSNGYPQATIIVKSDFAKENKEFINLFLKEIKNSVNWANMNKEIGKYCSEIGISMDANIINKSIVRANLQYVDIIEMKDDYNEYYNKLYDFDPKVLGGELPDEGIYFKTK